jgi:predicted fused transcriptional regulator/phosphomethylpyrimidine kinase
MVNEAVFLKSKDTILLKIAIAQILYQNNKDQLAIAKYLDISQAMVSNYCKSTLSIPRDIYQQAKQIVRNVEKEKSFHFQTCIIFSDNPLFGHFFIGDQNEFMTDENCSIVDNLSQSFLNLKNINLFGLIPEIKINIAMAKQTAINSDDIASFVNGLIIVDQNIVGHNGIRFGCSKHLSSLLLRLVRVSNIRAIMNIAYSIDLKQTKLSIGYLGNNFELVEFDPSFDILLHEGDFGIEPCAYILGKDAIEVSSKLKQIIEEGLHGK